MFSNPKHAANGVRVLQTATVLEGKWMLQQYKNVETYFGRLLPQMYLM